MCGIVAVLYSGTDRCAPDGCDLVDRMKAARDHLADLSEQPLGAVDVENVADILTGIDAELRGTPGMRCLLDQPAVADAIADLSVHIGEQIEGLEARIAQPIAPADDLERLNAAMVTMKDVWWAIGKDRLGFATQVAELAGGSPSGAALDAYAAIQVALSSLDRLELRGRDSAGLHVMVTGHDIDFSEPRIAATLADRCVDPLFTSTAVRTPAGHLSIVYKCAAEIGRLGDNSRALRAAIADDELLAEALHAPTARVSVVGHTRWASVGMINQANAHPLTSEELTRSWRHADADYVVAALNGDVDNYADLIADHNLQIAPEISTDAKVIPILIARHVTDGLDPTTAFRRTVQQFDGSVAIAANCAADAERVLLAQRGSGQSLLVGAAEGMTIVASELYGLVEHCREYIRLDGNSGEVVAIDSTTAGDLRALSRWSYDGSVRPVTDADILAASITTRDIDRRGHEHFLDKELHEAPESMRKTLRGRIASVDGALRAVLGHDVLSPALLTGIADGAIRRVIVIGQGTAAVAGQAISAAAADALVHANVDVRATTATELSGFGLVPDMSDTLVIAISQSGTTTDTNRTVDLVRQRGAIVIAIVNRRGSDLTSKADGVLYTADGRDVEMSVASTKAFYGQVAAGILLACALGRAANGAGTPDEGELLSALLMLPDALQQVLDGEKQIAALAEEYAPLRRSWAVVGSARNRIAAEEIRIKCSELTYRSISCDESSDKKHIDLSAEPLTLVCAAGMTGSAADDMAKEVEIFASHNGVPIVVATEGDERFTAAAGVIWVPPFHPDLAFVLSAMAGHLFGYHAALAIDAQAMPLREARAAIEQAAKAHSGDPTAMLVALTTTLVPSCGDFMARLGAGRFDGSLSAGAAAKIAVVLHAITTRSEDSLLSQYGGPAGVIRELIAALTAGTNEVSRTIDTIRHQAKTVTVGTSRSDEAIMRVPLLQAALDSGAQRAALPYNVVRTIAALDPVVSEVIGTTHYAIKGQYITVTGRSGIAQALPSRTEWDHRLLGTKLLVAEQRQALVAVGRSDGRPVIIVPEITDHHTTGLVLLHVKLHQQQPPEIMKAVLDGYRGRLAILRSAVTEIQPTFDERLLGQLCPLALLTKPAETLADYWCRAD